jgi:anti-anti-sigma regulatory factor
VPTEVSIVTSASSWFAGSALPDVVRRLARAVRRSARIAVRRSLPWRRRVAHAIARSGDPRRGAPAAPVAAVVRIDDPDVPLTLVRISGRLDPATVSLLRRSVSGYGAGHLIHLDLVRTPIWGRSTLEHLEALLDELELRRIAVRVVGLDPRVPAPRP